MGGKTLQNCNCLFSTFIIKIGIGYILKSADVGTLFSGRNSENSSHKLPTPAYTHPHPPAHTTVVVVAVVTVVVAFWTDQSYVNRPNTKKAERRRRKKKEKRKEQESAEAFSGLKSGHMISAFKYETMEMIDLANAKIGIFC